jgi:hypothetical protein
MEARDEAKASGIDAFVTKPLTPRQLIEVIDSVIHQSSSSNYSGADVFEARGADSNNDRERVPADVSPEASSSPLNMETIEELMSYMESHERRAFFEDFIADGSGYIETLRDCNGIPNVQTVRNNMHAFAGACLVIGADKLAAEARAIEVSETSKILSDHTELHEAIVGVFAQTSAAIRQLYANVSH